jgi:ElaB/YqjD/DUF883 family membrane-anchored ribosome-binding protein
MERVSTDKLMQDLQKVVVDAEDLLKATAGQTEERIAQARARAQEAIRDARSRMQEFGHDIHERGRIAAQQVNEEAHEHPWKVAAIAGGVGLLLGILLGRK